MRSLRSILSIVWLVFAIVCKAQGYWGLIDVSTTPFQIKLDNDTSQTLFLFSREGSLARCDGSKECQFYHMNGLTGRVRSDSVIPFDSLEIEVQERWIRRTLDERSNWRLSAAKYCKREPNDECAYARAQLIIQEVFYNAALELMEYAYARTKSERLLRHAQIQLMNAYVQEANERIPFILARFLQLDEDEFLRSYRRIKGRQRRALLFEATSKGLNAIYDPTEPRSNEERLRLIGLLRKEKA